MAFPYSSGDVLTAADLNASSGLVLVKTQTIGTSVTSVTVSDAFSSTFDNYKIITRVGYASTNNDTYVRIGGISTNTYDRTQQLLFLASTTPGYNAAAAQTAGYWGVNRAASGSDTIADIFRPYKAEPTTIKTETFYRETAGQMQNRIVTGKQ